VLDLASDQDAGDTLTYSLPNGNADGTFDDSTGQITIGTNRTLLYDGNTIQIEVAVRDAAMATDNGVITIHIVTNQEPAFITSPAPVLSILENTTSGAVPVGTIYARDDDDDSLTFFTDTSDPTNPLPSPPLRQPVRHRGRELCM